MLSENIFRYRRSLGLSQEQLAERIGVSRQTVSKWEGGQSTRDLEKLIALADCFEITLDDLVRSQDPKPKTTEPADTETAHSADHSHGISHGTLTGFLLLLAGVIGLAATGMVWLTNPDAIAIINDSSELTINGSGLIFSVCVLGMIFGVNLILKKD